MFLQTTEIHPQSTASEIVRNDYRTAVIFRKFGLDYCCGGRWPLETMCANKGIDLPELIDQLRKATRVMQLPSGLPFDRWDIDFLIDYIINVHHHYLEATIPGLREMLYEFKTEHSKKYPYYNDVYLHFTGLEKGIFPHIRHEEEVIFPYVRQVAHAYQNKDSFAGLLVRTLRKPVASIMDHEHDLLTDTIYKIRKLTDNYNQPPQICASHHVILSRLNELDHDLVQHIHLENEVLFPKIINMEKELLNAR